MDSEPAVTYTAFEGYRRIATGPLAAVALAIKRSLERSPTSALLIFDDAAGRSIDIDIRGTDEQVLERFGRRLKERPAHSDAGGTRGRGRPRLGVVSREVTLLPRHWQWLAAQPGGASAALRKLIDSARRTHAAHDRRREATERAYRFMSAIAGDLPGFEEASRALFARQRARFAGLVAAWPEDVREHALLLAFGAPPA